MENHSFCAGISGYAWKAEEITELPETKEHQNRNISTQFFSCFDEIMVKKMEAVLDKDRYIPQEILNIADF